MTKPKKSPPAFPIRNLEGVARLAHAVAEAIDRGPVEPIGYYRAAAASAIEWLSDTYPKFKAAIEAEPLPRRSWADLQFTAETLHAIAVGVLEPATPAEKWAAEAMGWVAQAQATEPATPKPAEPATWAPAEVGRALAGVFAAYALASAGPEVLEVLADTAPDDLRIPSSHYAILEQIPDDGRRDVAIEAWTSEFSRQIRVE